MSKRTIIVVYSNADRLNKQQIGQLKKYSFNTENEVKEGDILKSNSYTTNMHVVKVLDASYKYYNASTGDMSDEYKSTAQWEIRDLVVQEGNALTVYANLVK